MRTTLFSLLLAMAAGAGACDLPTPQPDAAPAPLAPRPPPTPPPPAPPPAPVLVSAPTIRLQTGAMGWLRVQNDYPITQWIFVDDGTLLGTVAPGQTETFEVPSGRHRFSSTDSASPSDNPVRRAYTLRRGQTVAWRVYNARM